MAPEETASPPPTGQTRPSRRWLWLQVLGAVIGALLSAAVGQLWLGRQWPGEWAAAPATFFLVMGITVVLTAPRMKVQSHRVKVGVALLYALFGGVVVGGIGKLLR